MNVGLETLASDPFDFVCRKRLFPAHDHFALPHKLLVEPKLVLEARRFDPLLNWAAQESHSGGRLKDVRTERAPIYIELDFQIAGVRDPRYLIARIEHHRLRDESYQNWALRHFSSLKFFAVRTIAHLPHCHGALHL